MCSENFKADFLKMASATPASFKNTSHQFVFVFVVVVVVCFFVLFF